MNTARPRAKPLNGYLSAKEQKNADQLASVFSIINLNKPI